jgi:uncharacterized membrane protein
MGKDLSTKQKEGLGAGAAIGTTTTAGAVIGSMFVPGIGTAIGAIIGAVVSGGAVIAHELNKDK